MGNEWYIQTEGGEVEGPMADAMLKTRADGGAVKPDTLIRKSLSGDWVAASKVKGLFATTAKSSVIQWYVTIEGEQKGPLTDAELKRWVASGRVQPDTFIRQGANGEWMAASEFQDMANITPVARHAPNVSPAAQTANTDSAVAVQNSTVEQLMGLLGIFCLVAIIGVVLAVWASGKEQGPVLLVYSLMWCIVGGALGGIIGSSKQAGSVGAMLGALFGPLGVIAAFAIDGRQQCGKCRGKLDGQPEICPHCHARFAQAVIGSPTVTAQPSIIENTLGLDGPIQVEIEFVYAEPISWALKELGQFGFRQVEESRTWLERLANDTIATARTLVGTIDASALPKLAEIKQVKTVRIVGPIGKGELPCR